MWKSKTMQFWGACVTAFLVLTIHPSFAAAEKNESTIGLNGGLMLPSFNSGSPTAFTLATWTLAAHAQYGVTDDLDLQAHFMFCAFDGAAPNYTFERDGRSYNGTLAFDGTYYHPEVGLRYKFLAGYVIAPYIGAQVGYLWSVYKGNRITNEAARLGRSDFAEGTPTLGVTATIDWRLMNLVMVGISANYTRSLSDSTFDHYVSIPLAVSYFW